MNTAVGSGSLEQGHSRRGRRWVWAWAAYLLLVAASHAWVSLHGAPVEANEALPSGMRVAEVQDVDDDGPVRGPAVRVAYREWGAAAAGAAKPPLVLIHGSPGGADDFDKMGPRLAAQGRRVVAMDLPGFGHSTRRPESYSTRAHARIVLALMDVLGLDRADVLGWSMGGGVVLNMVDIAPGRVRAVVMLAAIGDQTEEGSGSHAFEHAKYAFGRAALDGMYRLTPHFGLLGDPRQTIAYSVLRNFGDTDQRALRGVMERMRTPTLVVAGRDDFLVHMPASLLHHRLIGPSRMVVMDAMHFMPFLQAEETARVVGDFLDRDAPAGAGMPRGEEYLAPARTPPFGAAGRIGTDAIEAAPWWIVAAAIGLSAMRFPFAAAAIVAALINALALDWGVGFVALFAGVLARQWRGVARGLIARQDGGTAGISRVAWTRRFERWGPGFWLACRAVFRPDWTDDAPAAAGLLARSPVELAFYFAGSALGAAAWVLTACVPLLIIGAFIALRLRESLGWSGSLLTLLMMWLWVRSFVLLFTWTGRRVLLARLTRLRRHEYWPPWLYYAPLGPYLVCQAIRARCTLAFTACNPAMGVGGGTIGESKCRISSQLDNSDGAVLEWGFVDADESPARRAAAALEYIEGDHGIGPFPVVVKPDAGQRGFSVRVIREARELEAYFQKMTRPAMVQRYHPGPEEISVTWVRTLGERDRDHDAATGWIYSITRKDFPYVEGDGRHTLEQLIYRHPRHRCQASVFLARLSDDASRVIGPGERIRMALSGNHCQGTLFRDGADLITPELTAAVTRLALSFAAGDTHTSAALSGPPGLDFARFDLRYESEAELRAGRGFGVVELNGTTGESTNLYDPEKSLIWSYRVLFGQWRRLYELGAWRQSFGVRAWSAWMLLRSLYRFYKGRTGSALSD